MTTHPASVRHLDGPAGRLEARIDEPAGAPRAVAVVAPPHPELGKTPARPRRLPRDAGPDPRRLRGGPVHVPRRGCQRGHVHRRARRSARTSRRRWTPQPRATRAADVGGRLFRSARGSPPALGAAESACHPPWWRQHGVGRGLRLRRRDRVPGKTGVLPDSRRARSTWRRSRRYKRFYGTLPTSRGSWSSSTSADHLVRRPRQRDRRQRSRIC